MVRPDSAIDLQANYTQYAEKVGERLNPQVPDVQPGDTVIAVMGVTGSGKTTFVNHFSDVPLEIGHDLEACTRVVDIWPCTLPDGSKIFLVDTPGFDDTYRSDTDILREIANWLNQAYASKIQLTGIIYLHRILDVRLGFAQMKNLRMFKKLCGDDGLNSVVLATTMWEDTSEASGNKREAELTSKPEFWGRMIEKGSKVFRHDRGQESAVHILQYLIGKRRPVTLDISRDMIDQGKTLDQTAAGAEVVSEVERQKKKFEQELEKIRIEMLDALKKKDEERRDELEEIRKEMEEKLQRGNEQLRKMKADSEELRRQMARQHEEEMDMLKQQFLEKEQMLRSIKDAELEYELLKRKTSTSERGSRIGASERVLSKEPDIDLQAMRKRNAAKAQYRRQFHATSCIVM